MPNWCMNSLTLEHEDKAKIEEFQRAFEGGDGLFHSYLPIPNDVEDRMTWCWDNWGTKWDMTSSDSQVLTYEVDDAGITMSFDTAWSPPTGFYAELKRQGFKVFAQFYEPGVGFVGSWEDGADVCLSIPGTLKELRENIPASMIDDWGIERDFDWPDKEEAA